MSRIVVTGMGIISAIGANLADNRDALRRGICGISSLELFPSKHASRLPCGEIKRSDAEFRQFLGVTAAGVTRTSLLALHAAKEAIAQAGLTQAQLQENGTALIAGTTVGGMCLTDEFYQDAQLKSGGSEFINSYDCAATAIYLQQHFGTRGIINTINTACSSSANAILYGSRLIKNGFAKRAIVGGTDSLAKFTINGFNALHILSSRICTPFDEHRAGLNLGEAAAFLVLENEADCSGKEVLGVLAGYGNSNDAYHPSSLSDEGHGPFLSMQRALQSAQLKTSDISFVNAHGTGTENNDLVESRAMQQLFGIPPPFASTKSNTGHTLGAAGAVEAVYSLMNLQHQEVYQGLNCRTPIAETGLSPVAAFTKMPVQEVMSNSFGFGGNCTSLIFSKW